MAGHTVVDNPSLHRFETTVGDHVAFLDYARHDDHLVLVHTEVPEELEGHGVGGEIVQFAIDFAVEHSLVVVPRCPFARGWLERHPDQAARVTLEAPAA